MLKSSTARMTGLLSNIWPWKKNQGETDSPAQERHLSQTIGRYESFVIKFQSLLIWENPAMSVIFLIGVNILFWLAITLQFRFYSLACLSLLAMFVYNLWVEEIWPEIRVPPQEPPDTEGWTPIHPSVLSGPEISHYLSRARLAIHELFKWLQDMRTEQPGMFCCVASCVLLMMGVVGRTVPGVVLVYLATMLVMVTPGVCLHLLPPGTLTKMQTVKEYLLPEPRGGTAEEEEYMPDQSPETMAMLSLNLVEDVGDDEELSKLLPDDLRALLTNGDSATTTCTSLSPGLGLMPSHEEESMDGLELADLDAFQDDSQGTRQRHKTLEDTGIQFKSRHFNGDDSSDDDEGAFTRGLKFSDAPSLTQIKPEPQQALPAFTPFSELLTRAAVENVAMKLVAAVSSVAQAAAANQPSQAAQVSPTSGSTDESDEDFEIISEDDLDLS